MRACTRPLSFLLFLSLLLPFSDSSAKKLPDSNYVQTFPGTLTVRTYLGEKFSTFTIVDRATDRRLAFHPNSILGLGVGVTILGIGINVSTRLPMHDTKIDRFGKTSRYDIQVHRYGRKLMLDAYFQRYRGFHLNDRSQVTTITNKEEYPYFGNLQGRSIGFSALHVFNGERYSLRAMVNQQEWQTRSSGSALLGGSIFVHRFSEDDSSIIPRYYRYNDFIGGARPTDINYYGASINGGYGYTLVLDRAGHFFLAGAGDVGVGGGQSSVHDSLGNRTAKIGWCLSGNARVGAGYNSEKWFAGIYGIYHADYYSIPYDQSAMQRGQGIVRFVVARRLQTKSRYLARQPKKVAAPEPPSALPAEVIPAEQPQPIAPPQEQRD